MMISKEMAVESLFKVVTATILVSLLLIIYAIFREGLPVFKEVGFRSFVFGSDWQPGAGRFGIFPMIVASLYLTFGAVILAFPLGLLAAVFIAEIAKHRLKTFLMALMNLMAAVPSVVYGFWGVAVIVPMIAQIALPGNSLLAATIVVAIMLLPTIISVSVSALHSVPAEEKTASLALGESKTLTIWRVAVPRCQDGLMTALVLAFGRAIGEATAVALVAGNTVQVPHSPFNAVRTLTANCVIEMGYATGLHRQALMATGLVLLLFILIVNFMLILLQQHRRRSRGKA